MKMDALLSTYPFLWRDEAFPLCHILSRRPFAMLDVENCNASGPWTFSNATINVKPRIEAMSEMFMFRGAVQTILQSRPGAQHHTEFNAEQKIAVQALDEFVKEEKHLKCLTDIWGKPIEERKESEIQAVLAVHVFGPLCPSADVRVDRRCNDCCPGCNTPVHKTDTSFGHNDGWHGYADIVVRHSQIKITQHEDAGASGDQPPAKRARSDSDESVSSITEVKSSSGEPYMPYGPLKLQAGSQSKDLSQILAQTIVNAFIQYKKNSSLKNYFIPCFLASEKFVTIHMYNPDHDLLVTQGEAMTLRKANSIDYDTILTIWLALNFDIFPAGVKGEHVGDLLDTQAKSGFFDQIKSCLNLYKQKLDFPTVESENDELPKSWLIEKTLQKSRKYWEKEFLLKKDADQDCK
ncbi:uncharacterized protein LOC123525690 [Mercenaria mercenaria]|uniref:uncharacterized protein LOC123525690 n=1 Tax=Mercenaria mercenaria TaxID=6596 RepID=UPI00234F094E|nr:uncharacterized protein LOC123525690 [Mercenaria mercenaria]